MVDFGGVICVNMGYLVELWQPVAYVPRIFESLGNLSCVDGHGGTCLNDGIFRTVTVWDCVAFI